MIAKDMRALIDRLHEHIAVLEDFGPDGTLADDLRMTVAYLERICPPRESVMHIEDADHER